MNVRGIDFSTFYDFWLDFGTVSLSVVFFVIDLIMYIWLLTGPGKFIAYIHYSINCLLENVICKYYITNMYVNLFHFYIVFIFYTCPIIVEAIRSILYLLAIRSAAFKKTSHLFSSGVLSQAFLAFKLLSIAFCTKSCKTNQNLSIISICNCQSSKFKFEFTGPNQIL